MLGSVQHNKLLRIQILTISPLYQTRSPMSNERLATGRRSSVSMEEVSMVSLKSLFSGNSYYKCRSIVGSTSPQSHGNTLISYMAQVFRTGGLIAVLIGRFGKKLDECENFFREFGSRIFSRSYISQKTRLVFKDRDMRVRAFV
jgi:hypothetical protein